MAPNILTNLKWCEQISYSIIFRIEYFFNNIGKRIASNPWKTILICWSFVLISSLGLINFYHEKNPIKLWTPAGSKFGQDTEWLIKTFKRGYRPQIMLIKADDVLIPQVLQQMNMIDKQVRNAYTYDGNTWADVCFKIPYVDIGLISFLKKSNNGSKLSFDPNNDIDTSFYCKMYDYFERGCLQRSILEIWKYNDRKLMDITKEEILYKLYNTKISPVTGHPTDFERLLGGIKRNETGHIVSAESILSFWMVDLNFTAVDMDKVGNTLGTADWATEVTLNWETEFIKIMEKGQNNVTNMQLFYAAGRSFADISGETMFQDIPVLMVGIFFMVIYVQLVLSKYNCLEMRFILGFLGLLSIGMAFVVAVSLCSLFGVFYGPVHTSFPFLLMGLGVDDMFVIMACWNQHCNKNQAQIPLPERIGIMLQHAGVSITVTSLTDFVVFLIGSTTVLPSLKSYCMYAAVGILFTYIFVVTFFIACFTLDQRRVEENRNGVFPWYRHKRYETKECSQKQYMQQVLHFLYSRIILTIPGKVTVILLTIVLCGVGLEGTLKLKEKFDPVWFIPESTYLYKYIQQRNSYYPEMGYEAGVYFGKLNYSEEFDKLLYLEKELENSTDILQVTQSWVQPFRDYTKTYFKKDIVTLKLTEEEWNTYLSKFLFSPNGAKYQSNFQFDQDLKCGTPASPIVASSISIQFHKFYGPEQFLPAMQRVYTYTGNVNFTTGDKYVTAWGKIFGNWGTDEIIDDELIRNLILALFSVMLCTILLVANIQMCFWIFICVLLTMICVCGFMQKWGLTIDIVSCIALTLAIGLCVDYAAHIGYAFLSTNGSTRHERILKSVINIGSAVLNGGISTLLAMSMLSQSQAYTFQAFFKIFLLVVLFGQYYGIIFLPVVLSLIGPEPFQLHIRVPHSES